MIVGISKYYTWQITSANIQR